MASILDNVKPGAHVIFKDHRISGPRTNGTVRSVDHDMDGIVSVHVEVTEDNEQYNAGEVITVPPGAIINAVPGRPPTHVPTFDSVEEADAWMEANAQ